MSESLLVQALSRMVVNGRREDIEFAEQVLAKAFGFTGDVAYCDLDRAIHGAASAPMATDLPRVLSILEAA